MNKEELNNKYGQDVVAQAEELIAKKFPEKALKFYKKKAKKQGLVPKNGVYVHVVPCGAFMIKEEIKLAGIMMSDEVQTDDGKWIVNPDVYAYLCALEMKGYHVADKGEPLSRFKYFSKKSIDEQQDITMYAQYRLTEAGIFGYR